MSYGRYIAEAHDALRRAARLAETGRAEGHHEVASVLARRDQVLHGLERLAGLLLPSTFRRPGMDYDVFHRFKTLRQSLRRARTAAGRGQQLWPSKVGDQLSRAAEALAVAADILASNLDPVNGPRTGEGVDLARNTGREEMIVEVAGLAVALAAADQRLIGWMGADDPRPPSPAAGHTPALHSIKRWLNALHGVDKLAARSSATQQNGIRDLVVAPAGRDPARDPAPSRPVDCVRLLDDLQVWLIRHPRQVESHHMAAATRVGLLIAGVARRGQRIPVAEAAGWRSAAQAFGRTATPTPPVADDWLTHLGQAATVLCSDLPDDATLTALIERLPPLATAIRGALKQALNRGVVFTRSISIDDRAQGAIHRAVATWTRASATDPEIIELHRGLSVATGGLGPRTGAGAFPPLRSILVAEQTGSTPPSTPRPERGHRSR